MRGVKTRMRTVCFHTPTRDAQAGAVLQCSGEIDLSNVDRLEGALAAAIETGGPALHIDLREVRYLDSSTMHALLTANHQLARTGRAMSVQVAPRLARLFRMLRLDEVLDVRCPAEGALDVRQSIECCAPSRGPAGPLHADRARSLWPSGETLQAAADTRRGPDRFLTSHVDCSAG
jgi:anti-anti-sigma factor